MKIENEEQPILGRHETLEVDQSVHVRTGAENMSARTGFHRRSRDENRK
jgi:hypothetical protein